MGTISHPALSARQKEIAELIAAGKSNAEMAALLRLSERTIGSHVAALFNTLNVSSRSQVVAVVLSGPPDRQAARTNLPIAPNELVGRERAVEQIGALVKNGRLVTVTGAGGVGKTRTALAVGEAVRRSAHTTVLFVDLAPLPRASPVAAAVARVLNVLERPDRPLPETLVAALKDQPLLLILDNCEHVIAEAAALAEALLRGCRHLRVLATSREPLRVSGEQTWRLPSLPVPNPTLGQRRAETRRRPNAGRGRRASAIRGRRYR